MASANVINATDASFRIDVLGSPQPVLVDFWATWCGPCRAIAPHIESLADELFGRARVVKVDIDSNPNTPAQYGVKSIPTLLVFKDGYVVDSIIGNPGSKSKIRDMLLRHVG